MREVSTYLHETLRLSTDCWGKQVSKSLRALADTRQALVDNINRDFVHLHKNQDIVFNISIESTCQLLRPENDKKETWVKTENQNNLGELVSGIPKHTCKA
jgi:hypothetical protein